MPRTRNKSKGRQKSTPPPNMLLSSMSPQDRRNLHRLSQNPPATTSPSLPGLTNDVRFWRKGFDGNDEPTSEQTYQWSDYGSKSVKVRFRVDQWHSNQMKLIKYLRSTTRTHSSLMRALPFIVPLVFYIFTGYDIHGADQFQYNVPISVQFLRRVLTVIVLVVPTYAKNFDLNKVIGMVLALFSLNLSRIVAPDTMSIPAPPIVMAFVTTSMLVLACFHLQALAPFAFAGESVRAYLTSKLDKNNNPIWVEESSLTAALGQIWDPKSHRCSKILLSKLYPDAGIPDMVTSIIDFAVYKNMSTETLKQMFKARFWAFNLGKSWPRWVKSSDGTFYPLETVCLNPENFRVKFESGKHDEGFEGSDDELVDMDFEHSKQRWVQKKERLDMERKKRRKQEEENESDDDEDGGASSSSSIDDEQVKTLHRTSSLFAVAASDQSLSSSKFKRLQEQVLSQKEMFDGSDVWTLPPCECSDLNYPTTFLKTPRKVWSKWQKSTINDITSWWQSATSNWLTSTILMVFFLEFFGIVSAYAGVQSQLTEQLLTYGEKYLHFMWRFGTDPLRHLYRHGPLVHTPVGIFGFWNGKTTLEICSEKSGPHFGVEFWNSTHDLRNKCLEDYTTWENQFVNGVITLGVLYIAWVRFVKK